MAVSLALRNYLANQGVRPKVIESLVLLSDLPEDDHLYLSQDHTSTIPLEAWQEIRDVFTPSPDAASDNVPAHVRREFHYLKKKVQALDPTQQAARRFADDSGGFLPVPPGAVPVGVNADGVSRDERSTIDGRLSGRDAAGNFVLSRPGFKYAVEEWKRLHGGSDPWLVDFSKVPAGKREEFFEQLRTEMQVASKRGPYTLFVRGMGTLGLLYASRFRSFLQYDWRPKYVFSDYVDRNRLPQDNIGSPLDNVFSWTTDRTAGLGA